MYGPARSRDLGQRWGSVSLASYARVSMRKISKSRPQPAHLSSFKMIHSFSFFLIYVYPQASVSEVIRDKSEPWFHWLAPRREVAPRRNRQTQEKMEL